MKPCIRSALYGALLIGLVVGTVNGRADAESVEAMKWSVTPYIWGAQTSLDLSFRDQAVGSAEISFGDLLDILDGAFMIHVEGGKGHWSSFADITYLKISDREVRPIEQIGQDLIIDSQSEQLFLDVAVAWWPGGEAAGFNVFGGVRYTELDDRFSFAVGGTPIDSQRSDKKYTDALLGVRYRWSLAPRWDLLLNADGSFGGSEGTWLLRGLFGYTVGKRQMNRILFGYQYKQADFKDGDVEMDYSYQGPLAGFSFRF